MSTVKKVVIAVVIIIVIGALVGRVGRATDKVSFMRALDKRGYNSQLVIDGEETSDVKNQYTFSEDGIHATMMTFKTRTAAKKYIFNNYNGYVDLRDAGDFEGTVKLRGLFVRRLTVDGQLTQPAENSNMYMIMIVDGKTVISVYTYDDSSEARRDVRLLMGAMGYYI